MEIIEILALAAAVLALVKIGVNLINPKWSRKKAEMAMKNQALMMGLYIIFVAVLGYVVISAIGITNAFAAALFGASLFGLSIMVYPKQMLKLAKLMRKDRKKMILSWIIWVALAVWTLYSLYMQYMGI